MRMKCTRFENPVVISQDTVAWGSVLKYKWIRNVMCDCWGAGRLHGEQAQLMQIIDIQLRSKLSVIEFYEVMEEIMTSK